jgi:hypothetical protein
VAPLGCALAMMDGDHLLAPNAVTVQMIIAAVSECGRSMW